MNLDRFLDVFGSKDGGKYRADDAVMLAVAEALAEAEPPTPQPAPVVFVQRVDEQRRAGVATCFEVVDRRRARGDRIRKSFTTEQEARAYAAVVAPIGGAAYVYQAVDTDEYWHDTDAEQLANASLYNVISGCAISYDAADMTADLAAGAITHSGAPVQVAAAANGYTLVADGSNERWAALTVSSAGSAVLVSGDAAASSSVEPTKPEIGDRVLLAFVKIQAAQTIAANTEYQLDKRIADPSGLIGFSGTATATTSTSAVDLVTISKLGFTDSIPVSRGLRIVFEYRKTATAANAVGFGLKLNATTVIEAAIAAGNIRSSAANQAQAGFAEIVIPPRSTANYGFIARVQFVAATTSGGIVASTGTDLAAAAAPINMTAAVPNAAITSVIIRAINDTANNNAEVGNVYVYQL